MPSTTVTWRPLPDGKIMLAVAGAVVPSVLVAVKSNVYVPGAACAGGERSILVERDGEPAAYVGDGGINGQRQ